MATTYRSPTRFYIREASGIFVELETAFEQFSLDGHSFAVIGNVGEDQVYVAHATQVDATELGPGANKIYLQGAFDDYEITLKDASSGGYTISGKVGTDSQDTVLDVRASSNKSFENLPDFENKVYFSDGHVVLSFDELIDSGTGYTEYTEITSANLTGESTPAFPVSLSELQSSDAATSIYITEAVLGTHISPFKPGAKIEVFGNNGADSIYVGLETEVVATELNFGANKIYFQGGFSDYTVLSDSAGLYTLTGKSDHGYTEVVKVRASSNKSFQNLDDQETQLVFSDGKIVLSWDRLIGDDYQTYSTLDASMLDHTERTPLLNIRPYIKAVSDDAHDHLSTGDVVTFAVDLNGDASVTPAPGSTIDQSISLEVLLGTSTVFASYSDGNGTDSLEFTYTIQEGDNALGGLVIPADALTLDTDASMSYADSGEQVDLTSAQGSFSYVVVDTVPPDAPLFDFASIINTGTPTISGTAEAGVLVELFIDSESIDTVEAADDGTWSVPITSTLTDNTDYVLTAIATDKAGNQSTVSAGHDLHVDLSDPVISSITLTPVGADNNFLGESDKVRAKVTFSESVFFTKPDSALLTNVEVLSLSLEIGSDTVQAAYKSGNGTANLIFEYSIPDPSTLADADGIAVPANPIILGTGVVAKDEAGNTLDQSAFAGLTDQETLKVDTIDPGQPTINDLDPLISDNTPVLTGTTVEVSTKVKLYRGTIEGGEVVSGSEVFLGETVSDGNGDWTFTVSAANKLTDGVQYGFIAIAVDLAGNESLESIPVSTVVDTTAPAIETNGVVITSNPGGESVLGEADTVTVSVTFTENVTLTPVAPENARFALILDDSENPVYANYLSGSGSETLVFEYTIGATDNALAGIAIPEDPLELLSGATLRDQVDLDADISFTGAVATGAHIIDTSAPSAPEITLGDYLNDANPTISGTAEVGSTVELFIDDVSIGNDVVGDDGAWSVPITSALSDNTSYVFSATATDAAGNESLAASVTTHVDITTPSVVADGITAFFTTSQVTIETSESILGTPSADDFTVLVTPSGGTEAENVVTAVELLPDDKLILLTLTSVIPTGATATVTLVQNLGSLVDKASNALPDINAMTVALSTDATPPEVDSITAVSDASTYSIGEKIEFIVVFNEPVIITGNPKMKLGLNGTRYATYQLDDGADPADPVKTVTFAYTVQDGDQTDDLTITSQDFVYTTTAGVTDSIVDISLTDANDGSTAIPIGANSGSLSQTSQVVIDGERPEFIGWDSQEGVLANNSGYITAGTYDITFTMSEAVSLLLTDGSSDTSVTDAAQFPFDDFTLAMTLQSGAVETIDVVGIAVTDDGETVTLTLASEVKNDSTLALSYTQSGSEGIVDANGNALDDFVAADLTLEVIDDDTAGEVVSVAPVIANPEGVYAVGDTIDIVVTFNTGVRVPAVVLEGAAEEITANGSRPKIQLDVRDDTVKRYAYFDRLGDTDETLIFKYTVADGDASALLAYEGTSALTVDTSYPIKTAAGVTVTDLALPSPGSAGSLSNGSTVAVDGVSPEFAEYDENENDLASNSAYVTAGTTTITLVANEALSLSLEPDNSFDFTDFDITVIANGETNIYNPTAVTLLDDQLTVELELPTAIPSNNATVSLAYVKSGDSGFIDSLGNELQDVDMTIGVIAETSPANITSVYTDMSDEDTYIIGDPIEIKVVFDEVVVGSLSSTSGAIQPRIKLDVNDLTDRYAILKDESGQTPSNVLTFIYTVGSGDSTGSGVLNYLSASSFKINDGVVTDLLGTPVSTTLPDPSGNDLSTASAILIDGIAPKLLTNTTTQKYLYADAGSDVVVLKASESLTKVDDSQTDPLAGDFHVNVTVDGVTNEYSVTDIAVLQDNVSIELTLDQVIVNGAVVTVSYQRSSDDSGLLDINGNYLADIAASSAKSVKLYSDTVAPYVTQFTTDTLTGYYNDDDDIVISATMSEAVRDGATFEVLLNTGDVVTLTVDSGDATKTTLTGTYSISLGDNVSALRVQSYTLGKDGALVRDLAGVSMTSDQLPNINLNSTDKVIEIDTSILPFFSASFTDQGNGDADVIDEGDLVTFTFAEEMDAIDGKALETFFGEGIFGASIVTFNAERTEVSVEIGAGATITTGLTYYLNNVTDMAGNIMSNDDDSTNMAYQVL